MRIVFGSHSETLAAMQELQSRFLRLWDHATEVQDQHPDLYHRVVNAFDYFQGAQRRFNDYYLRRRSVLSRADDEDNQTIRSLAGETYLIAEMLFEYLDRELSSIRADNYKG